MRDNQICVQLFNVINITQQDIKLYIRELMTPIRCNLNNLENYIDLIIHGFKLNDAYTIMQAEAFYLTETRTDCLFYDGSISVLYNPQQRIICETFEWAYGG